MSLSADQRRILAVLAEGYKLLIVRSPLNGRIVGGHLWEPGQSTVEDVPLWRVERLVRLGQIRENTEAGNPAAEWTVTALRTSQSNRRARVARAYLPGC